MIRSRHLVGAAAIGAGLLACQPLDRTRDLGEGELHLRVVTTDGVAIEGGRADAVAGALVEVVGVPRMGRSGADGRAVVTSLVAGDYVVRVTVDDDGDLLPDRGALRSEVTIREADVGGRPRLTSFDLGDVDVAPLGSVTGVVDGVGPDELARVVVVRSIVVGDPARGRSVVLPVEGSASVAPDGTFTIERLVQPAGTFGGTTALVAMAWPKPASAAPVQQAIAASRPVRIEVTPVDVGSGLAVAMTLQTPTPPSVTATIELAGVLPPDRIAGLASFFVPGTSTDVDAALTTPFDGLLAPAAVIAQVPPSIFDLNVQLAGGESGRVGLVTAVAGADLLPVLVGLSDCLLLEGQRDCDGDGVVATADPDDDGDGVDDAGEPADCVGVGRGVDDDGDCLCGLADPFPGCASNDPADCTPAAPIDCGG